MEEPLHRLVEIPEGTRDKHERDATLRVIEESRERLREKRS